VSTAKVTKRRRKKAEPASSASPSADAWGLESLRKGFLAWMEVHHYAAMTIRTQGLNLRYFVAWCAERSVLRPGEVSREVIQQYQRWLYHYRTKAGRPLAFWTQHGRLVSLRMFFRWMVKSHHLLYNPAADLDLPRLPGGRTAKHTLSVEEVERVLALPDLKTKLGIRDRAILEVLYSTGIRRHELAGLELQDIDMERGTVLVRQGKGGSDRVVPIGQRALAWLEKYLREVRPEVVWSTENARVFVGMGGLPLGLNQLSFQVSQYMREAGITRRGACHVLRHTAATVMLEGGADVRFIQEMLGHKQITTTQLYTHVSIRKLKEVHEKTHPAANLAAPEGKKDGA